MISCSLTTAAADERRTASTLVQGDSERRSRLSGHPLGLQPHLCEIRGDRHTRRIFWSDGSLLHRFSEPSEPHIHGHSVTEEEVEDVLARPMEDRAGRDGSRVALGQLEAGRYLRVIDVPDANAGLSVRYHRVPTRREGPEGLARRQKSLTTERTMKKQNRFPPGWNKARVQRVLDHYEAQSDIEAVAEDEALVPINDDDG